ncbi:MAG TPA: GNAT family N-acetyltransferase [Mycobacteriales bacterium]|nr:GNAT family N-acetyltransferase [Mycobacteriales bacterium]
MDVVVRPAGEDDAAGIAGVHVASWKAAYAHALPANLLAALSVADRTAVWRRSLSAGMTVLVAEQGRQVVAFAAVGPSRDEDAAAGTVGELLAIYADPAHWDAGIGARLHEQAIESLAESGFREAMLWVLDDNPRARRFYERHGWAVDGATKQAQVGDTTVAEVRYRRPLSPK